MMAFLGHAREEDEPVVVNGRSVSAHIVPNLRNHGLDLGGGGRCLKALHA